jgi:hypothetical protein
VESDVVVTVYLLFEEKREEELGDSVLEDLTKLHLFFSLGGDEWFGFLPPNSLRRKPI